MRKVRKVRGNYYIYIYIFISREKMKMGKRKWRNNKKNAAFRGASPNTDVFGWPLNKMLLEKHSFVHFVSLWCNSVDGFIIGFGVNLRCRAVGPVGSQLYLHFPESFSKRPLIQVKTMTWLNVSLIYELSAVHSNSMCCNPIERPLQPRL